MDASNIESKGGISRLERLQNLREEPVVLPDVNTATRQGRGNAYLDTDFDNAIQELDDEEKQTTLNSVQQILEMTANANGPCLEILTAAMVAVATRLGPERMVNKRVLQIGAQDDYFIMEPASRGIELRHGFRDVSSATDQQMNDSSNGNNEATPVLDVDALAITRGVKTRET